MYKGLDIGTAKLLRKKGRRSSSPTNICEWDEPFTASDFKEKAEAAIADINESWEATDYRRWNWDSISKVYYIGFIIAVKFEWSGLSFIKEQNWKKSSEVLWNELNAVDPEAAAKISVNNPRRAWFVR